MILSAVGLRIQPVIAIALICVGRITGYSEITKYSTPGGAVAKVATSESATMPIFMPPQGGLETCHPTDQIPYRDNQAQEAKTMLDECVRTERRRAMMVRLLVLSFLTTVLFQPVTRAQSEQGVPVFQITPVTSKITFHVNASVKIEGTFEKWDSTLTFTSADVSTGHLDVKIEADSVNTGSESKDKKLKGKDCFDVEKDPYITFHSTKIIQTGPYTFDIPGTFTLRGISKTELLNLTVNKADERSGKINGTLSIDRKDYGLSGNIPFVKIADRVDVTIKLEATRVSGPALLK